MKKNKVVILGGGPAGLSAGYYAKKNNIDFTIYEASQIPGGNCRTINHKGFLFDTGAHRIHDVYPEITSEIIQILDNKIHPVNSTSSIFIKNRFIDFPLTPVNLLRSIGLLDFLKGSYDLIKARLNPLKEDNFYNNAINKYGKHIAELFLLNYSEKLWGAGASSLSVLISGKRLKGLDLKTFLVEMFTGKKGKTKHIDGAFLYPETGIGDLADKLSEKYLREELKTNSRITKIKHDNFLIKEIEINQDQIIGSDHFISTIPIGLLLKILDPQPPDYISELAEKIKFRKILLVAIIVDQPCVTMEASLYFPEQEKDFTRLYEPKNRSKNMSPADQTCIVLEIPMDQEQDPLTYNKLAEKAIKDLIRTGLIKNEKIIDHFFMEIPFAYPVLTNEAINAIKAINNWTSQFKNLYLTGRNSEFRYLHIHDLFKESRDLVNNLTGPNK